MTNAFNHLDLSFPRPYLLRYFDGVPADFFIAQEVTTTWFIVLLASGEDQTFKDIVVLL